MKNNVGFKNFNYLSSFNDDKDKLNKYIDQTTLNIIYNVTQELSLVHA